jgi:hypothetical protein
MCRVEDVRLSALTEASGNRKSQRWSRAKLFQGACHGLCILQEQIAVVEQHFNHSDHRGGMGEIRARALVSP